ncbi:MAG: hypothetical protein J6B75_04745 [Ruminococcus sp.]|nr:hypothetical protein [Ruminococcus sp.]
MKKLLVSLICLLTLTSCGETKAFLDAAESFLEENEDLFESYPVVTYDIENAVDGNYTVVYQLRTGFPDTNVDVEIKKSDDVIYAYSMDWNGTTNIPEDTSDWNDCTSLPEKIVYLFDYDGGDVYYVQNNAGLMTNGTPYDPICQIVYDGENVPDFMNSNNSICINNIDNNSDSWREKFEAASEVLQENITEQEIVDIFDNCGYDDKYMFEIYNYKGEIEND